MKSIIKHIFFQLPASYTLMFHHIDDGDIIKKSGCILKKDSFLEILDSGLSFIDADSFVTFSRKNKGKVLVTFDDGLADVYRVAYPEMKKRGIPFVVFIIANFLDTEGYITTEQLIELAQDPLVTIGSHGLSHDILKGKTADWQEKELLKSKGQLESLLGKPIKYFAYSHGQYDDTTLDVLKKHRVYSFVFGVAGYPTNFYTKHWKYHLPRLNCEDGKIRFRIENKGHGVKLKIN